MRSKVTEGALLAVAMLAAGCAVTPKPPAPVVGTPVKFAAVLQPGCLMPQPSEHGFANGGSAVLRLHVTSTGEVGSAVTERSSGLPALDAALSVAARGCTFAPAYSVDPVTHQRADIEDNYILNASWPQSTLVGPLRCFAPDYTHAARRAGEEGTVIVEFRINGESGVPETRVRADSARGSNIRSLSVRTVQACVTNHVEVRRSLRPDAWYALPYSWRLE